MKLRIRLSRTSWILLAVGIFVILVSSLGAAYGVQQNEKNRLDEELSLAQLRLAKYSPDELSAQQEELESQLAQIESEVTANKAYLSPSIENIEVIEALFVALAEATSVEVVEINSSSLTSKKVEEISFSALPFTVRVEGDVPNLLRFVRELSQKFPTNVVESIKMNIPEVIEGEEIEKPAATIQLLIYTYQGD